jgi:hypothetical protein
MVGGVEEEVKMGAGDVSQETQLKRENFDGRYQSYAE